MKCIRAAARLAVMTAVLLVAGACTFTRPFTDRRGRPIAGSVASMESIRIGGVEQSVWIRGRSTKAPILILLHGGPGASESPLFRHYDAALENHFVVVYWDQRGAGRSYRGGMPRFALTIARLLADLDELVDTVRTRLGAPKVVLLGHSWGTILGTVYAYEHPDKVSAYVGVAQIADVARGERLSLAWALREATKRGNARGQKALRALLPAPRTVDDELELGRWVERYGGTFCEGLSTAKLIWAAIRTDEAGLMDLARFGRGNRFSLEKLRPEYSRVDLTRLRHFEVPMFFMLGRHDWHVPAVLAAEYFASIEAPRKTLVWFERSAHNPPFEQPAAFIDAMLTDVLPLARASAATGGGDVIPLNPASRTERSTARP